MLEKSSFFGAAVLVLLAVVVLAIGLSTPMPPNESVGLPDIAANSPEPFLPPNVPVHRTE